MLSPRCFCLIGLLQGEGNAKDTCVAPKNIKRLKRREANSLPYGKRPDVDDIRLGDFTATELQALVTPSVRTSYPGSVWCPGPSIRPDIRFCSASQVRRDTFDPCSVIVLWLPKGWPAAHSVCLAVVVAQGLASCVERLPCGGGCPRAGQLRRASALLWWLPKGWPVV